MNNRTLLYPLMLACLLSHPVRAAESISVGVKLLGAGWQGDNGTGNTFESDKGSQFALNASYRLDRFYTGLNLQGGEYEFSGGTPDQFTTTGRIPAGSGVIEQNDFDLLVGYYVWPQVSVFLDIKAVSNNWRNNSYEQTFSGLGLGVTGFFPHNEYWTFYGAFGFVSDGDIKDSNDNIVGSGDNTALELGAVYALDNSNHINMGFKFRDYAFTHNNGSKQDYSVNALFVGYTHTFSLD